MVAQHDFLCIDDLLDNINDVFIATDKDFAIIEWNKAAERLYGIPAANAIGKRRQDVVTYEYLKSDISDIILQLKKSGQSKDILKYVKSDGSEIYLQTSASVMKDKSGNIAGYISVQRDITHQYVSEQSLQNFTTILHFLDESFLIVDKKRQVVFASPKQNVQMIHDSNYQIGDDALLYIPDALREEVNFNYSKAFDGEIISYENESDGSAETRIYLYVTYMPIKNSYGNVTHVAVIIKDLTEAKRMAVIDQNKKEAEALLHQSRKLFEGFMENCPLPSWITDEEGIMRYMNPTYLNDLFFSKDDIGKSIYKLFPKEVADEFYKNNMNVLANDEAVIVTEQSVAPDGSGITYLISKFPLYYQQKRMIGGWAIDITEQKKTLQRLEETSFLKDKILAVMAHDLRSPLSIISSIGYLAGDDNNNLSNEELKDFIATIQSSNDKALALLKDLTLWGQSKTNREWHDPGQIELSGVVKASIDFFREKLKEKELTVQCLLQPDTIAFADIDMVKTVVRNFLSNAIKFSPVQSLISITSYSSDTSVTVCVSDEGSGISDDLKSKILKGTNTNSLYGTQGEKGIGIGLGICKDFIDINKGIFAIGNNPEKGVSVSFSLPLCLQMA